MWLCFRGRKACARVDPAYNGECTDDFVYIAGVSKFLLHIKGC